MKIHFLADFLGMTRHAVEISQDKLYSLYVKARSLFLGISYFSDKRPEAWRAELGLHEEEGGMFALTLWVKDGSF